MEVGMEEDDGEEFEESKELSCDLKVSHYYLLTHTTTEREDLGEKKL